MDPLVPDWRTLGGAAADPAPPAAHGQASTVRSVPLTSRTVGLAISALISAAVTGALACLMLLPTGGSVVIGATVTDPTGITGAADDDPTIVALSSAGGADLVVDVEGAVRRPGLVHVPAGSRVGDALTSAGGFAPTADLARTAGELNLAQQVSDGLKVVVPAIGDAPASVGVATDQGGTTSGATGGLVDLNHATEPELDALPGVGPATIAKIVAARTSEPFRTPDDLRTRGIVGDAVMTKLRPLVTVGR